MKISIHDRLNKLETDAKVKNFLAWAMLEMQENGRFVFRHPEHLRDVGSFTEADFEMLHEKYHINTLIINDRKRNEPPG